MSLLLKNLFPKPVSEEPWEFYERLNIPYTCWEYMEALREDNPPKLRTIEGYRVVYQNDTFDHTWDTEYPFSPIIIGLVFKGKRECLGQGIWDAITGLELLNRPKTIWKLKGY